ncbi:hypothetical protein SAMN05216551_12029 [Chitinasiproducens palmae]|uniref:Uncharacterized protein n=1 Tax=Chitinasiproducens palmae TaxID=1770053 RepID=A0A1H2PWD5_9BURK|nr:hypothetical protein SAMN05216551_12029 [Chitinasiproducens palmae]
MYDTRRQPAAFPTRCCRPHPRRHRLDAAADNPPHSCRAKRERRPAVRRDVTASPAVRCRLDRPQPPKPLQVPKHLKPVRGRARLATGHARRATYRMAPPTTARGHPQARAGPKRARRAGSQAMRSSSTRQAVARGTVARDGRPPGRRAAPRLESARCRRARSSHGRVQSPRPRMQSNGSHAGQIGGRQPGDAMCPLPLLALPRPPPRRCGIARPLRTTQPRRRAGHSDYQAICRPDRRTRVCGRYQGSHRRIHESTREGMLRGFIGPFSKAVRRCCGDDTRGGDTCGGDTCGDVCNAACAAARKTNRASKHVTVDAKTIMPTA